MDSQEFTTDFNLQTKYLTYIAGSISPTPHQSWVFLFPIYISDFSSINVLIYAEYIQCTNVPTEILCNCYYSLISAPQFLIPVLSENFPYMKKPTVFQVILKKFFLLPFLLTAVFTGFSEKSIFHVI